MTKFGAKMAEKSYKSSKKGHNSGKRVGMENLYLDVYLHINMCSHSCI